MQALPNSGESPPDQAVLDHRFGFVVTKKMGGAVVRNRIRRRFKGALGVLLTNGVLRVSDIPEKIAFVLIARTSASTCSFEDLLTHLGKAIRRLSSLCTLSSASASKKP
jgi:ribonuclease P protein component